MKFYEREFSFFKKVTNISGIIRHDYMSSCIRCCLSVHEKVCQKMSSLSVHAYPLTCRLEVAAVMLLYLRVVYFVGGVALA